MGNTCFMICKSQNCACSIFPSVDRLDNMWLKSVQTNCQNPTQPQHGFGVTRVPYKRKRRHHIRVKGASESFHVL